MDLDIFGYTEKKNKIFFYIYRDLEILGYETEKSKLQNMRQKPGDT